MELLSKDLIWNMKQGSKIGKYKEPYGPLKT